MKNHGHGKAALISDGDYARLRKIITKPTYRLLFDIARYTGERWGAIVQLQVSDAYDFKARPHSHITFRASTRKAAPGGQQNTRQCPVHPLLDEILSAYPIEAGQSGWLFPNPSGTSHISLRAADFIFRRAVSEAGLDHKGISTHSTRRTFITRLYEKGVDLRTIQLITGHADMKALLGYVELSPDRAKRAIAVL